MELLGTKRIHKKIYETMWNTKEPLEALGNPKNPPKIVKFWKNK